MNRKPTHNARRVIPGRDKHIVFNNTIFKVIQTDHVRGKFTVKMIPPAQNITEAHKPDATEQKPEPTLEQYLDKTSNTPFVIIPRVFARNMPELWQKTLASLLEYYDQTWTSPVTFNARARTKDGKVTKTPTWVKEFRNPDKDHLKSLKTYYLTYPCARYIMTLIMEEAGIIKIEYDEYHLDTIAMNLHRFFQENPEFEDDEILAILAIGDPPEEWTKLENYKPLDIAIQEYVLHVNNGILEDLKK